MKQKSQSGLDFGFLNFKKKMVPRADHNTLNLRPLQLTLYSTICKPKCIIDDSYVHDKYVVEGLNMTQIAAELFTSRQRIKASLVRSGVEFKLTPKQKENLRHLKYGYKRERKKTIEHKAEQRTILAIYEMREKGLTFQAIADILHEMKIPTKLNGKKWTKGMVGNIYNSNV